MGRIHESAVGLEPQQEGRGLVEERLGHRPPGVTAQVEDVGSMGGVDLPVHGLDKGERSKVGGSGYSNQFSESRSG